LPISENSFITKLNLSPAKNAAVFFFSYPVINYAQFLSIVKEENARQKEAEKVRGKPYAEFSPGINYRTLNRDEFRNAWHNLPL